MPYLTYFLLFAFGTFFGSFLNVISLRYKPGGKFFDYKLVSGRSHCPSCGKKLSWYELIPIFSFLGQKGRCRQCKLPLSLQYPLVEFLSGLIFLAIPLSLGTLEIKNISATPLINYQLLITSIWILIFLLFLLLSVIDFRHSIIPDGINLSLGFLGLILVIITFIYGKFDSISSPFMKYYALIFGLRDNIWVNYIFAALLGAVIFGIIIILSKDRAMGWGDFKLIGAMGLIFGWPEILIILVLSFIIGAIFGVFLLIRRQKTIKEAIPFGPFLAIGATLVFFFGLEIISTYFKLFNLY